MEYRLVYDSGSKVLKCAIADEFCNIIALEIWNKETIQSEDGYQREWNHRNYWEKIIELTKLTIKSSNINPNDIRFITASSIRPSCVFTDENDDAVYIGASFDLGGINCADDIEEEFQNHTGKTFYESTGHYPSLLFIPARYKFFKEDQENHERFKRITQYLPMDSWILVKFGGEVHANIISAGESGFFDIESKIWHPVWNDILDLPDYFFPWPVLPGEIIGTVSEQYQKELGLNSETQLVAGISDTQAALLGCQCVEVGSIGAVLGSTSPVQAVTDSLYIDPNEQTWSGVFACKNLFNHYYLETNTGITGQLLKWAANLFYKGEKNTLEQRFQKINEAFTRYDQFEANASQEQIRETCVYSLLGPRPLASTQTGLMPGLFHFQSPGGLEEIDIKKEAFIAAVFDNIHFAVMRNIEILKSYINISNPSYSILGGITRNPVLVQRFSDLLQTNINTSMSFESSIQGMLVLCDIAEGRIRSVMDLESRNQNLKLLKTIKPRENMIQKLTNRYQTWQKLFQQFNG
ncbi:MAG: FGGY family carbohydrate kinase [Promethearchaeota archaeon]